MRSNSSNPGVMLASSRVHNPWLGADVLRPTRGSKPRARDVSIAKVDNGATTPTTMTGLTFGVPRNKTKKKKKDAGKEVGSLHYSGSRGRLEFIESP